MSVTRDQRQDTISKGTFLRMRRNQRNIPGRRLNPLRELMPEQQRSAEIARNRQRAEKLKSELPALIEDQVGEHMQKLESKLLKDFAADRAKGD